MNESGFSMNSAIFISILNSKPAAVPAFIGNTVNSPEQNT
jgi:hypothetical protein